MSDILLRHWRGVSSEEIAAALERRVTAEEVDVEVAREKAKLEAGAFDSIVRLAEQGDVAAVQWLEGRGFIDMPWKRSEEPVPRRPRIS